MVGSSRLKDRTMLDSFLPMTLMPVWLKPTADNSSVSSDPCSAVMVVLVVSREFIITGLRSFLENLGASFGAELLGKLKMVLQCAALFAIFLALYEENQPVYMWARDILVWAMLAATALSGLQYLWKAFALLNKTDA